MLGLRLPELLVILVVVVLMFGSKKLPELGESLGKGIRAFKKASEHGFAEDDESATAPKTQQGQLAQGTTATTTSSSDATEKSTSGDRRADRG
jgi:sec-independent protein translocase protein TatA